MCWRSLGNASTVAGTKPRFWNQCDVRVVSTNSLVTPSARARFSMCFRMRSPSPWACTSGFTVKHAISAILCSGNGYSAAQPKITPSCSITEK